MPKKRSKRAAKARPSGKLRAGAFLLDLDRRTLTKGEADASLTPKECALLAAFMSKPGEVLTRKFLMKEIWDTDYLGDTRTLDVHIRWLREKLEDYPSQPAYIQTVRRVGYCFVLPKI
ncbi:MAG: response regulator transcription factor [Chloroflexi bacterium]|nr:response regulator transcription factor [Chloroflexota bacterium]